MKKLLFLTTFIFILFISVSFAYSADITTKDSNDIETKDIGIAKTSTEIEKVTTPIATTQSIANSKNYTVTVNHTKAEQGKNITFTVTVKDSKGNPVVNTPFGFTFRGRSDTMKPLVGRHVVERTNSNGVFSVTVDGKITAGWFDYWDFIICDSVDRNTGDIIGDIYYNNTIDFTIKSNTTTMTFDISKSKVYQGEFTQVIARVSSNGIPVTLGYLVWTYADGKSVTTRIINGSSIFNYNSYILGRNIINVTYISIMGPLAILPGYVISDPNIVKSFSINVNRLPDLVIAKITRSGNNYRVTIKNMGKGRSTKTELKLWYVYKKSRHKSKIINVSALRAGQSKTFTVKFFKFSTHKNFRKFAHINHNKTAFESNHDNNRVSFKNAHYNGLLPDVTITKVVRQGNNYVVTISNQGLASSKIFKIAMWYIAKKKVRGAVESDVKFGTYGKRLPAGASMDLTIPYPFKYKTHAKYFKYISLNPDKKVKELNYKNNLVKFKNSFKVK
ncbi:MAG: hypothetical protein FWE58_03080 [Methanobrevibacter sp.]|nr:hypothetical protein [Methanobrevibacter sp.]